MDRHRLLLSLEADDRLELRLKTYDEPIGFIKINPKSGLTYTKLVLESPPFIEILRSNAKHKVRKSTLSERKSDA